ncbi:hypothetical protein E6B08_18825 [Pseudomonas putida]|uniref:D-glucuronyl C5-epimerase C-terminal domain-containing protein n=1 Tax=Pseudomonas putida TaxID=303 RepID=A0A4D6XC35_PSEPU|nr:D-glucuronyl C5-epimerase family protein [Pseudomonas putida]QCI13294.1 hypothetical protein E6B08_18825 [Pseudomonas putida]
MKKISITVVSVIALALVGYVGYQFIPKWPDPVVSESNYEYGKSLLEDFKKSPYRPALRSQEYSPTGDYMNYSKTQSFKNEGRIKLDGNGLPTVLYESQYQYNPITISNFALYEYGKNLPERPTNKFWAATNKLMSMQGFDGSFRYGFSFKHYALSKSYPVGWSSGMAQGLAMSVLARAYTFDKRQDYLDAGNKALDFLMVPVSHGGPLSSMAGLDPSLNNYIFFEEYIGDRGIYTLNGYMFTLIGLYDWWSVTGSEKAHEAFQEGMKTLVKILPYYDFGGSSSYDLTFRTYGREKPHYNIRYHSTHIYLLNNLYSITKNKTLKEFSEHWNPTGL